MALITKPLRQVWEFHKNPSILNGSTTNSLKVLSTINKCVSTFTHIAAVKNVLHVHRVVTPKDMFCDHSVNVSVQGFEFCLLRGSCVSATLNVGILRQFQEFLVHFSRESSLHSALALYYHLYTTVIKHGICTHPLKLTQISSKSRLKNPTVATSLINATFHYSCFDETLRKR